MAFGGALSLAELARAQTTLIVDLSTPIGPATHVGSGSLYGVTEKLPADIDKVLAPLRPKVFTNPAANQQQPVGDAIVVAGRLAPLGARVMIRLADWFKGWPYQFTSMSDWFSKVDQTVQRKKDSAVTNYYGYEIWNEPNGTWTSSSLSFNDFWAQTYAELRRLEPDAKIVGPSMAGYNSNYISNFLTYCKDHNVVPDIISWHELSGEPLTADLESYRDLEKQLGIGPLPISINEYSGAGQQTDEGKPGTSAPMIAKFERFQVDSACISYWDVAHAGRLGSLLATDTDPNGGWWFYKWYGDMTGNMVATTAPSPANATALDGFASLGSSGASVLFGGVNDGSIKVVVKGFAGSGAFGNKVHAVVERTPWVNRSTIVNATMMISMTDLDVDNDQITVSVTGTNNVDGFRLSLTPVGVVPMRSAGTGGDRGAAAHGGAGTSGVGETMTSRGGAGGGTAMGRNTAGGGGTSMLPSTQSAIGGASSQPSAAGSAGRSASANTLHAAGVPGVGAIDGGSRVSEANQTGCSCRTTAASAGRTHLGNAGVLVMILCVRMRRRRQIR